MKGNQRRLTLFVGAVAGALLLVAPAAQAATYNVSGSLNTGGHLVQYATFRSHVSGTASMEITDNVSGWSRFGLRNTSGVQVTSSLQFDSTGKQSWGKVATGSYALNGRMKERDWWNPFPDSSWAGKLTL